VVIACAAAPAGAATYPPGFEERVLVTGLTGTTGVAFAPDGRTFIIEKAGRVKVAQPGATTATQLLDISGRVNSFHDRGLLGIALDSAFASNGYIYLLYTYDVNQLTPDSSSPTVSRLTRIQLNANGTLVNPSSPETVLLGSYGSGPCPAASNTLDCIPSEGISHSIGSVRAAADGTLWVGSGDAADFNSVDARALRTYDEQSFAGKILHIDRNGRGLPGHPFCPANNNLDHVCTKLHSKGFRNPFRFHLRPSGGLAVADVGWNTWEEMSLIGASGGRSFGWPCYEASTRTPGYRDLSDCAAQYAKEGAPDANLGPDHEYGHGVGSAIIGGPTYTGSQYPEGYRNTIFFGDFTGNFVRRLVLDAQGRVASVQQFASDWIGTDLVLHPSGDLVYPYFGTGSPGDGELRRVVYSPGNGSPVARMTTSQTSGAAPLTVDFDGRTSSDPDGDSLTYSWDFGDGSPTQNGSTARHVYTQTGVFTARLTVSDGRGLSASATATISTTGSAPTATILSPADNSTYRDGDTITVQGAASDGQDGQIPASGLDWVVRLHHGDHIHPMSEFQGVAQATFTALRDHDADSFYEIRLNARDSNGLTGSRTITIRPQTVNLTLASEPAGAPVSYAGQSGTAPWTRSTAIGFDTTVSAAERFVSGGRTFVFDRWSDGGARTHDIRVPATDSTLRALYVEELASGRPASASGVEAAGLEAARAVDGDAGTRWASPFADGHWWQVDLGALKQVSRVELDWEFAYASSYRILTSTDGQSFSQAAAETASGPGTRTTSFAARAARYVRVEITQRATQWGASFWEARVFGSDGGGVGDTTPPETTISAGPSGTTSSTSASFEFSASEAGSSFECRLDNGAWAACSSPRALSSLAAGNHTFDVRATDPAGNTDPTPATRTWTITTASGYAAQIAATADLVHWWRLGDSGTTAADSRGTNAGAYLGGPLPAPSMIARDANAARDFDGVNDRVDLAPGPFGVPTSLSVEAWVRIDTTKAAGQYHVLVTDAANDLVSDGFSLVVDSANRPALFAARSSNQRATATSSLALTPGTVNHVVGTYDGARLRVYVNGTERASVAFAAGIAWNGSRDLVLGRPNATANRTPRHLDGRLDEVALYRSALSAATIAAHNTAGR
jgi:glucose/arabinose dehydrogenase/PKD repeat protein